MPRTLLCRVIDLFRHYFTTNLIFISKINFGLGIKVSYIFIAKSIAGVHLMLKHSKQWTTVTDPNFGPLGKYLERFRIRLSNLGYSELTIEIKTRLVRQLNQWLYQKKLQIEDLNEECINAFFKDYHKCHVKISDRIYSVRDFVNWLYEENIICRPKVVKSVSKFDQILNEYACYLQNERGLARVTVEGYITIVGNFLSHRFGMDKINFRKLNPADIRAYIFEQRKIYSLSRIQLVTTGLRSFFNYLRLNGDIKTDLAASVLTIADRSKSELPKYISTDDVNKLLLSCNQAKPSGIRNYAILILMARLGLRAKEISSITLDDINWEAGIITIRGKGGYHDELPLPKDVGRAIVAYLKKVRPKCDIRGLFVSSRAPIKILTKGIPTIVKRACQRAGLSPPSQGAHLLRHSLATRMLREGSTMTEIANILRHRSPTTTETYAKVDIQSLGKLARPWPGVN
jgi:site-specific recombinase XerD